VGNNSVADNKGTIFISLAVIASETEICREIPREFELRAVQGH